MTHSPRLSGIKLDPGDQVISLHHALLCFSQLTLVLGKYAFLCGQTIQTLIFSCQQLQWKENTLFPQNSNQCPDLNTIGLYFLGFCVSLEPEISDPQSGSVVFLGKWFSNQEKKKKMTGCCCAALQMLNGDVSCNWLFILLVLLYNLIFYLNIIRENLLHPLPATDHYSNMTRLNSWDSIYVAERPWAAGLERHWRNGCCGWQWDKVQTTLWVSSFT